MTVKTGTYHWGHTRPGWTYYPVKYKSGGHYANILWRRSRLRVALGWALYVVGIVGLAWAVASVA